MWNEGIEDAVYDRQAICRFVSIGLTREDTPPMPLHIIRAEGAQKRQKSTAFYP